MKSNWIESVWLKNKYTHSSNIKTAVCDAVAVQFVVSPMRDALIWHQPTYGYDKLMAIAIASFILFNYKTAMNCVQQLIWYQRVRRPEIMAFWEIHRAAKKKKNKAAHSEHHRWTKTKEMCTHLSDRILWNLCWVHAIQSNKVPICIAIKHSIMRPSKTDLRKKENRSREKFKQKETRIWCIFLIIPNKLIGIPWFNLHCFCFDRNQSKIESSTCLY